MDNNLLVSIITPAYNCKNTIQETYDSIRSQTYPFWEWIIVEDCSSDDSFECIKEMIKGDNRVILLRTNKNSGAAVARNKGIEVARGRYLAFLDADDFWNQKKLENQLSFMNKNAYAFTYTNYNLIFEDGRTKTFCPKRDRVAYQDLLRGCDIGCLTVIIDCNILGKVFVPVDCEKREDYGMWLDITKRNFVAHKLNEVLATYRVYGNSVSSKKIRMLKYLYRVFRKHENFGVLKSLFFLMIYSLNRITKY